MTPPPNQRQKFLSGRSIVRKICHALSAASSLLLQAPRQAHDLKKIQTVLGWRERIDFPLLVALMYVHELNLDRREKIVQDYEQDGSVNLTEAYV